jgi:hypothetical protein
MPWAELVVSVLRLAFCIKPFKSTPRYESTVMNYRIASLLLALAGTGSISDDAFAQTFRIIKGEILSEEGSAIPGMAVIELGTENAVVTDVNGQFELTVDETQEVYVHLFGLDLEIYLKYAENETFKKVHLADWKQVKKNSRKILNEWTAKNPTRMNSF